MILYSYEEYIGDEGEDSSYAWDDFKVNTETELDHLSYPITLEAQNSTKLEILAISVTKENAIFITVGNKKIITALITLLINFKL